MSAAGWVAAEAGCGAAVSGQVRLAELNLHHLDRIGGWEQIGVHGFLDRRQGLKPFQLHQMPKTAPRLVLLQIQVCVFEDLRERAAKVEREEAWAEVGVHAIVKCDLSVEKKLEKRIAFFFRE